MAERTSWLRAVFLGNALWSVPALEALAGSGHPVVLVGTRPPRPVGRGGTLTPTPVAEAARRLGLPLLEARTVAQGEGWQGLSAARPDVLVVVAYGEVLPPAVLELPTIAPVNVHFSLLPALRGAAPVQRAIMDGLDITGVSTMKMAAELDGGPVYLRSETAIRRDEDAGSLGDRLASMGAPLMVATLDGLSDGTLEATLQDETMATFAPKLRSADRVLDWTAPSAELARRVRALSPVPGAATVFRGRHLKILRCVAQPGDDGSDGTTAGTIVSAGPKEGVVVGTGDGPLRLDVVRPEGRSTMSGEEFARGYRPRPGEHLG